MYQVEGYAFETKEQEHTAKHEVEIIGYIRKNTRMDDPDIVLALYNKLVLKEIFVTPVGYDFLHRLQEYLYTIPYIRREDILPITVYEPEGMVSKEKRSKKDRKTKSMWSVKTAGRRTGIIRNCFTSVHFSQLFLHLASLGCL